MRLPLTALAIAALAGSAAVVGAGSAEAAVPPASCGSTTYFCAWKDVNFVGDAIGGPTGSGSANLAGDPGNFNDALSSVYNGTNVNYCLYPDANFGGTRIPVRPHTQIANLATVGLDNKISSMKPC
jgi:hypothetical protein